MRIGVPKEIKNHEYRVGMTPAAVRELTARGHEVFVETNAGEGIGLHDAMYTRTGAKMLATADEIFATADMIVKVKEPQPVEIKRLKKGQTLFTYLHLAPDPEQTKGLLDSGAIAIAYETVTDSRGGLPLLQPMSEVAGRMSIQAGAHCLEIAQGGRGVLLGGVPGVLPAKVVVLGGGVVGTNAARMAMGLEAHVTIMDISLRRLNELDLQFGSVLVDVAIDQGGCAETSHATTHANPTYRVHDVVHYCVANMPGAVAGTSTFALNNATLPFTLALADLGPEAAMKKNAQQRGGLNGYKGTLTHRAVGEAQHIASETAEKVLGV